MGVKFNLGTTSNISSSYDKNSHDCSLLPETYLRSSKELFLSQVNPPEQRLSDYLKTRFESKVFIIATSVDELEKELNLNKTCIKESLKFLERKN